MDRSKWNNNIGTINESKAGKLYIKIDKSIQLNANDNIILKKKSDEIREDVEAKKITEERGEELLSKLSFIKYSLHLPPKKD